MKFRKSRKVRKSRKIRKMRKYKSRKYGGVPTHTIVFTIPLRLYANDDWREVNVDELTPAILTQASDYLTTDFVQDLMTPFIGPPLTINPGANVTISNHRFKLTLNVREARSAGLDGRIRSVVESLEQHPSIEVETGVYNFGPPEWVWDPPIS